MNRHTLSISSAGLEKAVVFHLGVLLLAAGWGYGGNIWWMRSALAIWADLGVCLTLAAFMLPGDGGRDARRKAWWLLPWLLFVLLVVASSFNPSFVPLVSEGDAVLVHRGAVRPEWPSTVNPSATLRELAFGAGVYLAAFNILLAVRSRRALRRLLIFGVVGAVALAVFGTIQKLTAAGFYFGAATSPNIRFFSTFIYYNHWGAFMILWLTTVVGFGFYYARNHQARDVWHSPFTVASTGALILAISAPVSASRAATGMTGVAIAVAFAHSVAYVAARRRARRRSPWPAVAALLVLAILLLGATGWLARRSITERYAETRIMLANDALLKGRTGLYRDTWNLAMQKPVFGWGLESYGTAFMLVRPRPLAPDRQYEASYVEAHSDWLQSVAETGLAGTALLLLMALIPLFSVPLRGLAHPLVGYPLFGCVLIVLYAWVEFPFASGAVLIAFWTILFSATRYARLREGSAVQEI